MELANIPSVVFDTDTIQSAIESHGIMTRFIYVLECEAQGSARKLPRFNVGGAHAKKDPREVPLDQLHEISRANHACVDLKAGWGKVHHFVYVIGQNTDEHGWEYRSDWSDGVPREDEEQWSKMRPPKANVRRRLWITTCVHDENLTRAKYLLEDFLSQIRKPQRILTGDLVRRESSYLMGITWTKRHFVMWDDRLEIYPDSNIAAEATAAYSAAIDAGTAPPSLPMGVDCLKLCDIYFTRIFGEQLGRRDTNDCLFSIRDRRSDNILAILDAETPRVWKRWVSSLTYLIALNAHNVDYPPFENGPPSDDLSPYRVVVFGHLDKQGHFRKNWRERFFTLTPFELIYYKNQFVKGRLQLHEATLLPHEGTDEEKEEALTLTLRTESGHTLTMRAEKPKKRKTWETYIQIQIDVLRVLHAKYSISSDGTLISTKPVSATTDRSTRPNAKSFSDDQYPQQLQDLVLREQMIEGSNSAENQIAGRVASGGTVSLQTNNQISEWQIEIMGKLEEEPDDGASDSEHGAQVDKCTKAEAEAEAEAE
eukprot:GSChrysophyteH1.ASY1.ANO1.914.1 assembled CDS